MPRHNEYHGLETDLLALNVGLRPEVAELCVCTDTDRVYVGKGPNELPVLVGLYNYGKVAEQIFRAAAQASSY